MVSKLAMYIVSRVYIAFSSFIPAMASSTKFEVQPSICLPGSADELQEEQYL